VVAALVSGCGDPNVRNAQLLTSGPAGSVKTAGTGDMVMDIKITRPLPNLFGRADVFGRTTDAGRVLVRYVGNEGERAAFVRQDIIIQSNETTMSRTPLVLPSASTTTTSGVVGSYAVSAQQTTTGYVVVPPTPAQMSAGALQPVMLYARPGGSLSVEGRTLTVHSMGDSTIQYSVQ
jgi:hypothetical protein